MSESVGSTHTSVESDIITNETNSEIWRQIARIPFDLLSKTNDFMYIEKVMRLASSYRFETHDEHMSDPQYTTKLGSLLLIISSKSLKQIDRLQEELMRINNEKLDMEKRFRSKIENQDAELLFFRGNSQKSRIDDLEYFPISKEGVGKADESRLFIELAHLKDENAVLSLELDKLKHTNEELSQLLQTQYKESTSMKQEHAKMHLEYKHLVSRHRRLIEKFEKTNQVLEEYRVNDTQKSYHKESEFERLREEMKSLREENYSLIVSRDRTEELCEQRESEALRDMTELRRLTKDLIDEERSKLREATEYYMASRKEHDANMEHLIYQHSEELRIKDEEIALLRQELVKTSTEQAKHPEDSHTLTGPENEDSYNLRGLPSGKSGRHQLEHKNVDLAAEVEELELRIDAMEEENKKLTGLIKDYEGGNEGLLHLRHQLTDRMRAVEMLEDENVQLRERLNYMADSLTFTAALEELCKSVGVSDAEINSLRSKNATGYNEVSTLKEEINVLKEEIEWLEKDRRHWMNKVRLQPLMDTKLRFELGLTTEQLKRLDKLVDHMKSENSIVEDEDAPYKENYYNKLEARHKDAQEFNEYAKAQIENAIKSAFSDFSDGANLELVLASLRKNIDLLKPLSVDDTKQPSPIFLLKMELESAKRQVGEFELMVKDNESVIQTLHEKLAVAVDEKEALIKERDQYKGCMFATLGLLPDAVTEAHAENSLDLCKCDAPSASKDIAMHDRNAKWDTIASSLRDQLKIKDSFIEMLNQKLSEIGKKLEENQRQIETEKQLNQSNLHIQESLNDKIAALQEMNEEINEENVELKKINTEVTNAMAKMESGGSKELLQKVVLLRRREAKLLSRLRKAIAAQADSVTAEKRMQATIDSTLKSLQEALEGSSTGFVLPPSSAFHDHEKKQLDLLHTSLESLLKGKLFRDDSRYLLHLQRVYNNIEISEEVCMLREKDRASTRTIDALQNKLDQLKLQVELQRSADLTAQCQRVTDVQYDNKEYNAAAVSRWESECIMWRQKYELCYKRLEAKTEEVSLLEKDLDATRQEMVDIKDNVRNLLQTADFALPTSQLPPRNEDEGKSTSQKEKEKEKEGTATIEPCGIGHVHEATTPKYYAIEKVSRLERDMARLKSVNLGLLQHSLDLQSALKSLEIELEASKQEAALIRDANNTKAITDFVNAAVHEHAALRRQSELALIQVKQLKIQLTATEANYQVVANEATSYKLSAYRLYRRYVDEIVAVVDYIRCLQRACKGSLSPHRTEIMDKRFRLILQELGSACERNKSLATKLSDKLNTINTLEQQVSILRVGKESGQSDAIEHHFLEARATIRKTMHQLTECEENLKFSHAKAQRTETYAKDLSEEITRLEFRCWNMTPLEEASYEKLLHLRDTVFAKAETPPLAIQPIEMVSLRGGTAEVGKTYLGSDDDDIAIREYKTAILKQKELARECADLREELEAKSREVQKISSNAHDLQDHIKHLEGKVALYQGQFEGERIRAEEREVRLRKAQEMLSEVSRKASERNSHCLRDMIQRKDKEILQLQEQLHAERQKHAEQQLEEASRLERFHERIFSENEAMIERFKNAIQDKGGLDNESRQLQLELPGADSSIFEQLRSLTSDNIRLKRELEDARTASVVLESQLNQQNQYLQEIVHSTIGAVFKGAAPTPYGCGAVDEGAHQSHSSVQQPAPPSLNASTACSPPSAIKGTDILTGIINNQGAMIESLRQREMALTNELQREKELHKRADTALHELQAHQVEQEGTLRLVTQVSTVASDSALVRELRSNISYLEQELCSTKETLNQEKILSNQLQMNVEDWKKHLESLQLEMAHQHVEVERSVHLAALNQALQNDLGVVKEQNEKLMTAVSLLKEKLVEEAQRGSESARQYHQELALARRMGVIQSESMEHIKILDHRIKSIQKELNERVDKEKESLTRYEDTQRMVYQLHQNLRHKETELVDLRHQLHRLQGEKGRPVVDRLSSREPRLQSFQNKGTQVLATDVNLTADALDLYPGASTIVQPIAFETTTTSPAVGGLVAHTKSSGSGLAHQEDIVSSIAQKACKMEFNNLHCISELRSQLAREEKDLADAREHLTTTQESNRQLRQQLRAYKKDMEEMVKHHTYEVAQLRSLLASSLHVSENGREARPETNTQQSMVTPKPLPLAEVKSVVVGSQVSQQEDQQQQDSVLEELRRKLQVDVPARENVLRRRIVELDAAIARLVERLAQVDGSNSDEVRRTYTVPFTEQEKSVATLQDELLEKNNIILDLRFTQENLNLQISYLHRRIVEYTNLENTRKFDNKSKMLLQEQLLRTQRTQQNQMEAMVATIDNLKVLIEHLRAKNSELTFQASHAIKCDEVLSEVKRLRSKVGAMQENFLHLLRASSALAQPTTAPRSEQQSKLRQRLSAARAETEDCHLHPETHQAQLEGQLPLTGAEGNDIGTPPMQQRPFSVPAYKENVLLPRLFSGIELNRRSSAVSITSELAEEGRDGGIPPPLSPAPFVDTFASSVGNRHIAPLVISHEDMGHHFKLKRKSRATKGDQI